MISQKIFALLSFSFLIVSICGCASSEIGESKDVAQETIYQQYHISYSEGDEAATINAQFRFAGDLGTTLVLTKPSSIKFDGIQIAVDSNDYDGAFYRKNIPAGNFYREHSIQFTDINNKVFNNSFSPNDFKLVNAPEIAIRSQALQLHFGPLNLRGDDRIEVFSVDTDSSFSVSGTADDHDQFISIPSGELKRQKGTQLKLSAILYKKVSLQQSTKEGGTIELEYSLKPFVVNLLAEKTLYTAN